MKKRNMLLPALLLALVPAAGYAQDTPKLPEETMKPELPIWTEAAQEAEAVYRSIGEGLEQGVGLALSSLGEELTLTLEASDERVEAGKTVILTLTAGNPMAKDVEVSMVLDLPERLKASGETTWTATLPAARLNEETGKLEPSVTAFTRELTLLSGGGSEQVTIGSELAMGTRFYRAQIPLALCVPDVTVQTAVEGPENQRLQPGGTFAYKIAFSNAGDAPKDMTVELILPEDVTLTQELPEGFEQTGKLIRGKLRAEKAENGTPACMELTLPAMVAGDALDGDADARRLIAGTLRVDGERVPLERIEVCGAKINARLMADMARVEGGEETTLSVVVVNSGLAEADVHLSCVLPKGLKLAAKEDGEKDKKDDAKAKAVTAGGKNDPGAPAAEPVMTENKNTLMLDVHMDAAEETPDGVIAATKIIELPVIAETPQNNLHEQLVGASLAWSVGDEGMQLGEAVAMRVVRPEILGLSRADWNGVFWAGVLLVVTLLCLYAAVRKEDREEDFCCE